MTFSDAILKAQSETATPGELSEIRLWLAGRYAYLNGELTQILIRKPEKWRAIRYSGEVKSDSATDRWWDGTEDGMNEMKIRLEQKSIEKLLSATKTRIEILQGESRSQF